MSILGVSFALISGASGAAIIIRRMIKGELPWFGDTLTPSVHIRVDAVDWVLIAIFIIFFLLFAISMAVR